MKAGSCTLCEYCTNGYYRVGCSGLDPGYCAACPACPAGFYRNGCTGNSVGTCVILKLNMQFDTRSGDYQYGPDGSVPYTNIPAAFGTVTVSSGTTTVNGQTVPRGMQIWTVGTSGWYDIVAAGAGGADYLGGIGTGGRGVAIKTRYYLTTGAKVAILVGAKPTGCASYGFAGGGGGSFVTIYSASSTFSLAAQHTLLLAAGGGGGSGYVAVQNGVDASTGTSGTRCQWTSGSATVSSAGGGGGGGALAGGAGVKGSSSDSSQNAAGGAGYLADGGDAWTSAAITYSSQATLGGRSFLAGGIGGFVGTTRRTEVCTGYTSVLGLPPAGFGGGGGSWNSGGGGGGYSGGQGCGSGNRQGGGGGGSYDVNGASNAGTLYTSWDNATFGPAPAGFSSGYMSSDGIVAVSLLACPSNTRPSRDSVACVANPGFYIGSAGTRFPPSPYMSGDTFTSGSETFTALASSYYSPSNEAAWRAFSGASTSNVGGTNVNAWTASQGFYPSSGGGAYIGTASTIVDGNAIKGEWLQLQSTARHTLGSFSIMTCHLNPTRAPKSFVLAGSNDGAIWVSLHAVSDLATWTANLQRTFPVPVLQAFSFFRLITTNTTGATAGEAYLTIDKLTLYDAQVTVCTGSCAVGTTKFCSPDGATTYCCTSNQYFISGISTACVTCPANSAPDSAYQERCVANAGFYGPTLYMFDGSTSSYRNLGSRSSHVVSPVGWRPTFSSVASRTGAYFDSSVNGNYYVVSNDYGTITLAFWIYVNAAYVSGVLSEVVGMYSGNTIGVQFVLGPDNAVPGLYVVYGTNGGSVFTTAAQFPVNQWLHAVLVIPSGTDRLQRVFVNGVKAGTRSNNLASTQDLLNFQTLLVGASQPFYNRKYKGYLQQLTMYNYAMTDAEAIALYNSGGTPLVFTACTGTCTNAGWVKHCTTQGVMVCCPAGTFFREEIDFACQPCPAGTYSGTSASSCTLCQAGTFSLGVNQILSSACTACPSNSWSYENRTGCLANTGYYNLEDNLLAYYPFRPENIYQNPTGNGYTLTSTNGASYAPQSECMTAPFPGAGVALLDNNDVNDASSSIGRSFRVSVGAGLDLRAQIGTGTGATAGPGLTICFWSRGRDGPTTPGVVNAVDYQAFIVFAKYNTMRASSPFHYNDRVRYLRGIGSSSNTIWDIYPAIGDGSSGVSVTNAGRYTRNWIHQCAVFTGSSITTYFDCAGPTCTGTTSNLMNWPQIAFPFVYLGTSGTDRSYYGWLADVRLYKKALSAAEVFAVRSYSSATAFSVTSGDYLLAYYPFSASNIYADASGNGYTLGNTNAGQSPTYDGTTSPFPGAGAVFMDNNNIAATAGTAKTFKITAGSGFDLRAMIGTSAAPGEGFSVCFWYKAQSNSYQYINGFSMGYTTSGNNYIRWIRDTLQNDMYWHIAIGGSSNYAGYKVGTGRFTTAWTHVCLTMTGLSWLVYYNCESPTCTPDIISTSTDIPNIMYNLVYIGQFQWDKVWYGWFSEVRLYKKALTPAEVYAVRCYTGATPVFSVNKDPSLMAYYPFNQANIYADASGNGLTLTALNSGYPPAYDGSTTPFPGAGVALLDNNNVAALSSSARVFKVTMPSGGISFGTLLGTAAAPGTGFSFCAWYKGKDGPTAGTVNTVNSYQTLFSMLSSPLTTSPETSIEQVFDVIRVGVTNQMTGYFRSAYNNIGQLSTAAKYTNTWTHICVSCVGLTTNVYYDCSSPSCTPLTTSLSSAFTSTPFLYAYIGQVWETPWYGWISEVRLYKKALSAAEVFAVKSYGSTTPSIYGNNVALLAYYPFNQGNIYADASGNGYDLGDANTGGYSPSYGGGTTAPFPGAGSAYFNNWGSGSGVTISSSTSTGNAARSFRVNVGSGWNLFPYIGLDAVPGPGFSWCYWLRGQDGATPGVLHSIQYPFVFTIGTSFNHVENAAFSGFSDGRNYGSSDGGYGSGTLYWVNGVGRSGVAANGVYTRNWNHVCFTWQGKAFKMYLNCASSSCAATASVTLFADAINGLYTQVLIGQGTYSTAWYGWLSEFRFYKKALTPAEVYAIKSYDGTSPTAVNSVNNGLLAYYPFHPNAFLVDASGVTGSLTNTGSVASQAGSLTDLQNVAYFAQSGGLQNANANKQLFTVPSITIGPAFSVCMWYNPDSVTGSHTRLISFNSALSTTDYVEIRREMLTNNLCTEIFNGATSITASQSYTGNGVVFSGLFQLGVWQHMCMTLTGTTGKMYYNGALSSTFTLSAQKTTKTYTSTYLGYNVWISAGNTNDQLYRGQLDEVRIYSRAISAAEVASIYNFRGDTYTPAIILPCELCPAGSFGLCDSSGRLSCTTCREGTYSTGVGMTTSPPCIFCQEGKFSSGLGLSTCTVCAAGTYNDVTGVSICTSCPSGTYGSTTGLSRAECTPCAAGTYSGTASASASSVCTPCVAGTYSGTASASASSVCTPCAAGTYSGTTSASASSVCTPCVAGTYSGTASASASSVCTPCVAGTYSGTASASASSVCTSCVAGTYSGTASASSSSVCIPCVAGTYSGTVSASSSSVCTPCAAGTYSGTASASSSSVCLRCPAGTFNAATGRSSSAACGACPAGTYTGMLASTACTACPLNSNSAGNGAAVCTANAGYYNMDTRLMAYYTFNPDDRLVDSSGVTGSLITSENPPTFQASGPFGDSSHSAVFKPQSHLDYPYRKHNYFILPPFNLPSDISICTWYWKSYYTNEYNTDGWNRIWDFGVTHSHLEVQIDGYSNNLRIDVHNNAEWIGLMYYVDAAIDSRWMHICMTISGVNLKIWINGIAQALTMSGTISAGARFTRNYVGKPNQNNVEWYWFGYMDEFRVYTNSLSASEVSALYNFRGDTYSPMIILKCPACPGGQSGTCLSSGTLSCTPCIAGSYSSGASACTPCAAGSYSSSSGVSACTPCAAGSYGLGGGLVECTPCPAGTYSASTGWSVCLACPTGTYSASVGATVSTVCVACGAGTYNAGTGGSSSAACGVCPAGMFTGRSASSACTACPANSDSASGASVCTANAGFYNLDASLKAYYTFNPGELLRDTSGVTGYLSASTSSPTSQATGPFSTTTSYSAFFTGTSSQFFQIPSLKLPDSVSICSWFAISSSISRNWNRVFDFGNSYSSDNVLMTIEGGTTNLKADIYKGGSVVSASSIANGAPINTWQHTCYVISGTSGNFWLNNVAQAISLTSIRNYDTALAASFIGKSNWPADGYWFGAIDEFRIYTKALSASEVSALYRFRGDTYSPMIFLQCLPCAEGSYGPCLDSSPCTSCSAGTYSSGTGMITSATCQQCSTGKYSSGLGMLTVSTCTECGAGTYSITAGGGSSNVCLKCSAGTYSSGTGMITSATCQQCSAGKYSSGLGMLTVSTCTECGIGTYSVTTGESSSSVCLKCSTGTYNAGTGGSSAAACGACPAGTYTGMIASTACTACPANSNSAGGLSICTANVGYYNLDSNLQAYYTFNPGELLRDTSNVTGALVTTLNSPTSQPSGPFGVSSYSAFLTGSASQSAADNQYFKLPSLKLPSDVSVCTWYWVSPLVTRLWNKIWKCGNGLYDAVVLSIRESSKDLRATVYKDITVIGSLTHVDGTAEGAWRHACLTITGTTTSFWLDGASLSSTLSNTRNVDTLLQSNYIGFAIGGDRFFYGAVDEFRIYKKALTPSEYNALYSFRGDTYSPMLIVQCPPCPSGQYGICLSSGALSCTSCVAGTYSTGTGMLTLATCQQCSTGTYSATGASACVPCSAGTYTGMSMSSACTPCPDNSNSGSGASVCTANAGYYNLDNNLKAYYTFNPGELLRDTTGVTGFLTPSVSSPTSQATGPFGASSYSTFLTGSASTVAANNQYFTLPSLTLPNDMTICAWFWISPSITRTWNRIWDFGLGAGTDNVFATVYGATSDLNAGVFRGTTRIAENPIFWWTNGASASTWKHTCLTLSGTAGNFWLDNSPKTFTMTNSRNAAVVLTSNFIGRSNWASDYYWYGAIDEFRIYTKALSSSEVAALYSFRGDTYSPMIILQCLPCAAGSYGQCLSTGGPSCTSCSAGTYSTGLGMITSATCQQCGAGTYSGAGAGACTACVAGTYSGTLGATVSTVCLACGAGTYSASSGASSIATCTSCGAGTFSASTGASLASACTACVAGSYSGATGAQSCTLCGAGTYSTTLGATLIATCQGCFAGAYSTAQGLPVSASCVLCGTGTYSTVLGASLIATCQGCIAGTYSTSQGLPASASCVRCWAGTYSTGTGMATALACQLCAAGTYSSGTGIQASCTLCVAGTYYTGSGATLLTTCASCSAGLYGTGTGSTVASVCLFCSAGTYATGTGAALQGVCISCIAGSYSTGTGMQASSNCALCGPGSYSSTLGANSAGTCQLCAAGKYFTGYGLYHPNQCYSCGAGAYSTALGGISGSCTACPAGTFSTGLALADVSQCPLCVAGTYSTGIRISLTCTNCLTGTYSTGLGMPSSGTCTKCLTGTYSSGLGVIACDACLKGTFASLTGLTICTGCSLGSYANIIGLTICTSCPTNSNTSSTNSTQRGDCLCNPGYAGNLTITTQTCAACPANSYCVGLNQFACPAHTHSPALSSLQAHCRCDAGYKCRYGRDVRLTLLFNLTATAFASQESSIRAQLAALAGVPVSSVYLESSMAVSRRRLLEVTAYVARSDGNTGDLQVFAGVLS